MSFQRLGCIEEREYWALRYDGNALPTIPWADAPFDVTVIADSDIPDQWLAALPRELVRTNAAWVATVGAQAEQLHDAIDNASVIVGRQHAVGDGIPMTSWHEDASDLAAYLEHARLNLGGEDRVLVLFIGEPEVFGALVSQLRRLTTGSRRAR